MICIAGKNNIAVDIMQYLLDKKGISPEEIVICCNKTETGDNKWQRSLRFFAKKNNIKEVQLEELYEQKDLLFLSLEYDKIINPFLFESKKLYNIHFSMLPKYKGMYTSAMPLLNNEQWTGVTFHEIDRGIDTGNILLQKRFRIEADDTSRDVYLKYIKYGTSLVKDFIDLYFSNWCSLEVKPQNFMIASYYSRNTLDYGNLVVDLNQTAINIRNQIRAFNFREYQIPEIYGKSITQTQITNIPSKDKPGTIIWKTDDRIEIASIDYNIVLYIDQFENILEACKNGNLEELKKIKNLSFYVNQQNQYGWTPLMVAVYNDCFEIVQLLLTENADISLVNYNGANLLMYAKEAFLKFNDSRLFEQFYHLGLDLEQKDYSGNSLIDYCKKDGIGKIGMVEIYKEGIST